jgi:hypothetical protein
MTRSKVEPYEWSPLALLGVMGLIPLAAYGFQCGMQFQRLD